MKSIFVFGFVILGTVTTSHANCLDIAESCAAQAYRNCGGGDPMGRGAVRTEQKADGSVLYKVTEGRRNPETGAITFEVTFTNQIEDGCTADNAVVQQEN